MCIENILYQVYVCCDHIPESPCLYVAPWQSPHPRICTVETLDFIKRPSLVNAGEGVEKREPSYTVGGNVNWCSHYGEQYGHSLKN